MSKGGKNNKSKTARTRNWTRSELELYAIILADEENCFASSLEKLALKKSANNKVYSCIKKVLDKALKSEDFAGKNEIHFKNKDGTIAQYEPLDTGIDKLRKKYANLKTGWRKITDRAKSGSGLSPKNEPKWYYILNEIFSETNAELDLVTSGKDTSFSLGDHDNYIAGLIEEAEQEKDEDDGSAGEERSDADVSDNPFESENEQDALDPGTSSRKRKASEIKKTVAAPHAKHKVMRSQKQALSELAQSVQQMANAQLKKHRESIENDLKRDKMLLDFKREEAEKNREHELKMAQIFANALINRNAPPTPSFASPAALTPTPAYVTPPGVLNPRFPYPQTYMRTPSGISSSPSSSTTTESECFSFPNASFMHHNYQNTFRD